MYGAHRLTQLYDELDNLRSRSAEIIRQLTVESGSAVHHQGVADDEGRGMRTQREDGVGDFFGLTDSTDRFLRDHLRRPSAVRP